MFKYLNRKSLTKWGLFLLTLAIAEIYLTVMMPQYKKLFYSALEIKQIAPLYHSLMIFGGGLLVLAIVQGIKTYVCHRTGFIVRQALVYDMMIKIDEKRKITTPTPCGRINEDTRLATDQALPVYVELFISLFIVISVILSMMGTPWLLIGGVVYSGVSIGLAVLFRKPLITKKNVLQGTEGEHRKSLMKPEKMDIHISISLFIFVREAYYNYIKVLRDYTLFSRVQTGVCAIIPFIVLGPLYVKGNMSLGDLMSYTLQFELLVINLSVIIYYYSQLMEAQTSMIRIKELYEELNNDRT